MRILTDKGIQFRTFPVVPRKRIKYDEDTPVVFKEFGSSNEVFKCLGGYFTHNSYRLLDYFVSHWFEIACRKWTAKYGGKYPSNFFGDNVDKLSALSPIMNMGRSGSFNLDNDLLGICLRQKDYVNINTVSDRAMRSHASLKGISSATLKDIIEKMSCTRLKVNYPIRTVKTEKKKKIIGYSIWSNLSDSHAWSKIFDYRLIEEIGGTDSRILERVYKFSFKSPLGVAMINNTISGGFWSVNPALYQVSADAQLLYRYLVITGTRRKNNTAEYLAHRLGWREKQKSRIIRRLKVLFEEMCGAGLIQSYEASENHHYGCLFSYTLSNRRGKKKPTNEQG